MSYLGSTPASQFFAPGTDTFSGTGSQTAFTLSRNVATVNDILVVVNNVDQQPSHYTVLNNVLTFSPAPSAGTNNIYVRYLSTNLQSIVPQQGSVTPASLSTPNALYWDTSGNVGVGTTTPTTIAGKSLQISDRSAFYQLTVNNSTYLANNLYYDGTNWRYITTGLGVFLVLDSSGSTAFYRAASGTAGAVATIIATSLIDASSNFSFNSGYGTVATAYGCRAWVNFNGTGTPAIRASGNVSSITDNGVGLYTANFSVAMPDVNYAAVAINDLTSNGAWYVNPYIYGYNTTSVQYANYSSYTPNLNPADCVRISIAVFR
jgi:hypothetical protein